MTYVWYREKDYIKYNKKINTYWILAKIIYKRINKIINKLINKEKIKYYLNNINIQ